MRLCWTPFAPQGTIRDIGTVKTRPKIAPEILLATTPALSILALAKSAFGLGLSLSFGGTDPQTGIGLRLVTDTSPDGFAGSLGGTTC
jgi:hypothetical protein